MRSREPSLLWPVLAGAVLGGTALAFGQVYFGAGASGRAMTVGGTAGAALMGGMFWWVVVEAPEDMNPVVGGAIAGGATGVAAHPVAWLVAFVVSVLGSGFLAPMVVFSPLLAAFATLYSLVVVGWATVPLGATAGALVGIGKRLSQPD